MPNGSGSVDVDLAAILAEDVERGQIDDSGIGIAARDQAASDMAVEAHRRVSDPDGASDPAVLLVRRDAVDLDQHPEPARIDHVLAGDLSEPGKGALGDE